MKNQPNKINQIAHINGSYKISQALFDKLVSNSPCISSFELDTIIYFTQISDSTGFIADFKISELQHIIHCSLRSTFCVIKNLVLKGFIRVVEEESWTGIKSIQLLDNDFSTIVDFRNNPYIDTNRSYFNPYSSHYDYYQKLSLYAKKTLLIILFNYKEKFGYRVSTSSIRDLLQIKSRSKIVSYLKELETLLGTDFYFVKKDSKRRLKYGNVVLPSKNRFLLKESGISEDQDSYFKRKWELFMKQESILEYDLYSSGSKRTINILLNKLFSIVYTYLKDGVSIELIDQSIKEIIERSGVFDLSCIENIKQHLRYSIKTA